MKKAAKKSRRELKKHIKQLEAQLGPFGGSRLPPVIVERPEVVTLRAERTFSKALERWRPPEEIIWQDLVQGFGSAVWKNGLFTATKMPRQDRVEYAVECRVLRPTKGEGYGRPEKELISKAVARIGTFFDEGIRQGLAEYDKEPIGLINDDELKGLRTPIVFTEEVARDE